MKRYVILFLVSILPLMSSHLEDGSPRADEEEAAASLNGILLLADWNQVRKNPVDDLRRVAVDGVSFLQKHPDFLLQLQDQYLGKPLTQATISNIKNQIADYYLSKNQPLVVVTVPRQNLSKGVLQVVIDEVKLGQVYVQGNCYFPSRWFAEALRINEGDPIQSQTLLEDVAWLNLNPFRRTDAILKPGSAPGVADIELVTIDRWPYRVYMGGDNTGTEATDRNRMFFGFDFGKSILKDGQIAYQFTFAPNWNLFYSHTASARLPLPWRHVWVLWGGYSQVEPKDHLYGKKNRGISWQVDTRYRFPFFSSPQLMQTFVVGYDFKETNNYVGAQNVYIFKETADINQFMLGYELGYRNQETRVSFTAEVYASPGGITHDDDSASYKQLRFGANNKYVYCKLTHSAAKKSRFGWFTYDVSGQASSANLLPSEQFTMTGYNAVRGYEERILNLDNALILNVAYETPHWNLARTFGFCRNWDELYFLAFFDYGMGGNHNPQRGEAPFQRLASAGPGIRYQIDRFFTARLDYGFQLGHTGFENPSHSRYNFGMILSY